MIVLSALSQRIGPRSNSDNYVSDVDTSRTMMAPHLSRACVHVNQNKN